MYLKLLNVYVLFWLSFILFEVIYMKIFLNVCWEKRNDYEVLLPLSFKG